jgi:hypothetical protein
MARDEQLARLSRWAFPLVSIATLTASNFLVPRILQLRLGDGEYVAYVTVMAVASYMSLAEGGLQWSITREMSAAHGSGIRARFAGEVRRARRAFLAMTLVGCVIAGVGAATALPVIDEVWPGATTTLFRLAVLLELLGCCLVLGLGGYFSVLYYSTGRLLAGQLTGFIATILPLATLIVCLVATHSLTISLIAHAATLMLIALTLGYLARGLGAKEAGDVDPVDPSASLGSVLGAGVALKFADVLPSSAFPHLLSSVAPAYVPAGIPARTFVGAGRLVVQQFLSLLQIHVTRRIAAGNEGREQGYAQYRAASTFLTSIHLLQLGLLVAVVQPVFQLWLPARAPEVARFLPGMMLEQSLLAASLPSSILFTAVGRLKVYGVARLIGVALGLAAFLFALPSSAEAAFGYGLAASAVPPFLLGAYSELRPLAGFPARSVAVVMRYGLACVAGPACLLYATHPVGSVVAIVLCGIALFPQPSIALYRMFRGVTPTSA